MKMARFFLRRRSSSAIESSDSSSKGECFDTVRPDPDVATVPSDVRKRSQAPLAGLFRGLPLERCAPNGLSASVVQQFSAESSCLVDFDVCYLDDQPVRKWSDWASILRTGRLGDVEGAFAIAWIRDDGSLSLARDGIGERTLYYAPTSDGLAFASSIAQLLRMNGVRRELSPTALAAYLSCAYLPGRETLVRGVFELLPGEMVTWREGSISRDWIWRLPAAMESQADESALRIELRRRLAKAVERRLPENMPAGIFLSGGLDSSLVVALACVLRHGREQSLHQDESAIKTYSVSFGPGYANELDFSSAVARHCGTKHRIVELSPPTVLAHLDHVIGMLSEPIGDPLTVPNAMLFREASGETGVVLNGEGGDPCFGGPKNLPMLLAELYGDGSNREGDAAELRSRSYLRAHLKCYDDLPQLLTAEVRDSLRETSLESQWVQYFQEPNWSTYVGRLQAMNIVLKGAHHILPKVDALSRPFGVLARSPLFDRSVVELSMEIPSQWKLRGSVEKYLLKEAVRDLLPASIVDRPKSGMLVPVEGWFQGPLRDAARERLLDGLTQHGIIRRDYLERLVDGRLGGLRPRHGAKIWLLVTLEAWLRRVLYAN